MKSRCKMYRVDAFATKPFTGNPAAVCLLQAGMPQKLQTVGLQQIAAELKQPATCFVSLLTEGDSFQASSRFGLRWFSPSSQELPLCGHGTLATAAALVQGEGNQQDTLHFETLGGQLSVQSMSSETSSLPTIQITLPKSDSSMQLPNGLKLSNESLKMVMGSLAIKEILYSSKVRNALVVLADGTTRKQLESLQPDMDRMVSELDTEQLNGVMVTCQGDREPYHFLSRYFAPWIGVGEDAVTGSAHTALGPYWATHLSMIGQPMTARQCSQRGGDLQVTVNEGCDKVVIASQAVIVSRGELCLPE
ncbi:hypothetical protein WJX82_003125 [Trebouxia sp. C0006]